MQLLGGNVSENHKSQLKIDTEPKRLLITSEPYAVYSVFGYTVAVDVLEMRSRRNYFIYISPKSISVAIEELRKGNNGKTTGLEFWLRKESEERSSQYILEE